MFVKIQSFIHPSIYLLMDSFTVLWQNMVTDLVRVDQRSPLLGDDPGRNWVTRVSYSWRRQDTSCKVRAPKIPLHGGLELSQLHVWSTW